MKVKDIMSVIEAFAPLSLQMEWDNCGLKTGEEESNVTRVLVTLDTTPKVVDEAIKKGCQMIVEHHPVIFQPISKLDYKLPAIKSLVKAIKHDIAIYSTHTNTDFAGGGLNDYIAEKIGLTGISSIDGQNSPRIGLLEKPVTLKEYAEKISEILGDRGIRTVGDENKIITKAAVANGGGGTTESVIKAFNSGAEVFITGDVKYSTARLAKDMDYAIITFGHYESEFDFAALMCKLLKEKLPELEVLTAQECENPFN